LIGSTTNAVCFVGTASRGYFFVDNTLLPTFSSQYISFAREASEKRDTRLGKNVKINKFFAELILRVVQSPINNRVLLLPLTIIMALLLLFQNKQVSWPKLMLSVNADIDAGGSIE